MKFERKKNGSLRPVGSRPGKTPIEIDYKEVENMARLGLYDKQIQAIIGYASDEGFIQRKYRDPELVEALAKGRATGIKKVANALYEKAMQGDTTAQIFFLKTRAGWNDKLIISGDPDNPVRHVISAEPMDIDEWEKKHGRVIDQEEQKK